MSHWLISIHSRRVWLFIEESSEPNKSFCLIAFAEESLVFEKRTQRPKLDLHTHSSQGTNSQSSTRPPNRSKRFFIGFHFFKESKSQVRVLQSPTASRSTLFGYPWFLSRPATSPNINNFRTLRASTDHLAGSHFGFLSCNFQSPRLQNQRQGNF